MDAPPEQRRAARKVRQGARADRDVQARVLAAISIETAAKQAATQPAPSSRPKRATQPTRQATAIAAQAAAGWQGTRAPTRAQMSRANKTAWAQQQLDVLTATAAARTSRRGKRRQARSQTWLAAQAARITAGLESSTGLHATEQKGGDRS
jgi:hypothetical protein